MRILLSFGSLLAWPQGRGSGSQPSKPLGLVVIILAVLLLLGAFESHQRSAEVQGTPMWCKNLSGMAANRCKKKEPTETVACPCGKYVWKG